MNDPKNTICRELWAYPVISLTQPRVRACCKSPPRERITKEMVDNLKTDLFLNLPSVVQDRKDSLNGIKPENCRTCWSLEESGQKSYRLGDMDFQFHFNNERGDPIHFSKFRPFETLIEQRDQLLYSDRPNKLDLQLGTYCDQKCVYCNADFSTQWETEDRKFGELRLDPDTPKPYGPYPSFNEYIIDGYYDRFLEWFDTVYEHLERIALLGGEPTFSPMFVPLTTHIISKLKEKSHPNCAVSIVTNLNWTPKILNHVINIRKELPINVKLILEISMESFGSRAEYIRFGIDWERFSSNLRSIAKLDNVEIKLITTLNGLCISSIQDYFKLVKEIEVENNKNFQVISNRLVYPKYFSFDILDESYSHYVKDFVNWFHINYKDDALIPKIDLYNHMVELLEDLKRPKDKNLLGYFTKWISALNMRRNVNFVEIFPEFKRIIDDNHTTKKFTIDEIKHWKYL